jgi:hypothetical protein
LLAQLWKRKKRGKKQTKEKNITKNCKRKVKKRKRVFRVNFCFQACKIKGMELLMAFQQKRSKTHLIIFIHSKVLPASLCYFCTCTRLA